MDFDSQQKTNSTTNRQSFGSSGAVRSSSMGSTSSEGNEESHIVDHEDIVVLTQQVRAFKEALAKLKKLVGDQDNSQVFKETAHERLGEVLRILRLILEKYPVLQSAELLVTAGTLIHQIKELNSDEEKTETKQLIETIDQLALAFSSRVSEYLMGDLDGNVTSANCSATSNEQSYDSFAVEADAAHKSAAVNWNGSQMDSVLVQLEQGVELALHRAKLWSKYAKDIISYVEKKIHLETELAKNVTKLAQTTRCILKEECFLPFQSIYMTALDQEIENANALQTTVALLLGHKFIEPLSARRNEYEKHRKQIKETWQRELKRMQESVNNLRKAKALYIQKQQDWDRAKEASLRAETANDASDLAKIDKRRKTEEDALQKAMEAEVAYKSCVSEANDRHYLLVRTKGQVLKQLRELMLQCDQTMKAVTASYFQLQQSLTAPVPVQFQTLYDSTRLYEPGSQYMEFIKSVPVASSAIAAPTVFTFEPYSSESATNVVLERDRHERSGGLSSIRLKAWDAAVSAGSGTNQASSDTESVESNPSSKSREISPVTSPSMTTRRLVENLSSGEELDNDLEGSSVSYESGRSPVMSKAAVTHTFRKPKTPSRCRECDSYVYFQGIECTECGLASHKKCLSTLAIQCGHKRLPRKMTTFGVDLNQHLVETGAHIPHIVAKCVSEIDTRGIQCKGIYRLSSVKSKVEKLCQAFENGAELVDLTDVHPNVISNVLKLYLRQLPEPLLTSKLYPEFIKIAKELTSNYVEELRDLCRKLPRNHFLTLAAVMHHLKRVADRSDVNNMPSSNLGIVFGPTLLQTAEGAPSLSSLVDTVHQTKIIEILIDHAEEIFGPMDPHSNAKDRVSHKPDVSKTLTSSSVEKVKLNENLNQEPRRRESVTKLTVELQSERLQVTASSPALAERSFLHSHHVTRAFRGSLHDHQGAETVNIVSFSTQARKSSSVFEESSQADSALSSPSLSSQQSKAQTCFVDSFADSDQSWESQSTGSSGRGTQHSDQWSLNLTRRGSRMSCEDEVDRVSESSRTEADEHLVKIQVPSGAVPPIQRYYSSQTSAVVKRVSQTSSHGCVTIVEGPLSHTTVVESAVHVEGKSECQNSTKSPERSPQFV